MNRFLLAVVLASTASTAAAQEVPVPGVGQADSAVASADHRSTARSALLNAGGLALLTAATMPFDQTFASAARAPALQRSSLLHHGARVANMAGGPGVIALSVAMYGVGRLTGRPELADIGRHTGEAIVVGGIASSVLKVLAGRQRPYVEAGDPDDFAPAHGTHAGRSSLPSGHTTAAFAFASAAAVELHRHHPAAARIATPLLYAGATSVGLARMYDDRHWASDVVLGAGIGTLVGTQVVAYSHSWAGSWLGRHLDAVAIGPTTDGWGVAVGVHRSPR